MKKRIRKCMVAMAALLCGMLAIVCVIPVGATEHPCIGVEIRNSIRDQSYSDNDDGTHTVKYYVAYACQTCGRAMGSTDNAMRTEGHNRNRYRDLGHQRESTHKYEIYCGDCTGGKIEIYLNTCDWQITGYHATPW